MKLGADCIRDTVRHLTTRLLGHIPKSHYTDDEPPLRAELFSAEQMEQHGRTLAGLHRLRSRHAPDPLLSRLADNEHVSLETCNLQPADGCRQGEPPDFSRR